MKWYFGFVGVAILTTGAFFLPETASLQTAPTRSSQDVTLLITLGLKANSDERWDGSVGVAGGEIVSLEGHHFSRDDVVLEGHSWKCSARRDELPPLSNIHYTEMRPGSRPQVLFHPVGLYLTLQNRDESRVSVTTAQGNFEFLLSKINESRELFLAGRASVVRVPSVGKLTTEEFEDDEAAITVLPDGAIAVAWVAYRDRADRVLLRTMKNGSWSAPEEVTERSGDIFRCTLASDGAGNLWAFWSRRQKDRWHIWARHKKNGAWQRAFRLSEKGSNIFPRSSSLDGHIFVVWQSFRGAQSDIYMKTYSGRNASAASWSEEIQVSESPANDWEPAVCAGREGTAFIAWDSYDKGNYDIHFRSFKRAKLSSTHRVTSSPRFQAHASVAVDHENRPWVAWDESGANWGKDQGFLIVTPLAVPLHQQRSIRVAMWDGWQWMEPKQKPSEVFPQAMRQNAEHPQIVLDGKGALNMVFRHWTRRESRRIGSRLVWENYLTRFDGNRWSTPLPMAHSAGSIEKHAALAKDTQGLIWGAWMSDNRPFSTMIPQKAEIYVARLGGATAAASLESGHLQAFSEEFLEAIPVHPRENSDVKAIRSYTIPMGDKEYKIYRGDMHRHSDISADFKYDGSLIEIYRYALDAAAFDYIAPTDHQSGFDQEFTWWQSQKLVDVFLIPGSFTPLFAYERSLRFPNGHRNIVFAHRGVRTLPIPRDEAQGKVGPAKLYQYLHENRGISMPHSIATDQGTDWQDNDPEVEPLVEIYQGYRNSYEYEGAPRAAHTLNLYAQKSGWQPIGFWWTALAKGYKLGVQASSDHWSTHISYACIISDSFTREGLLDAIRKRHCYGATDNIILDFRAEAGGITYLMGDIISSRSAPKLMVRAIGTGTIRQIDLIKNQQFIYTTRPLAEEASFQFVDADFQPGRNYYYVRVLQQDGQLAWASPIWVE